MAMERIKWTVKPNENCKHHIVVCPSCGIGKLGTFDTRANEYGIRRRRICPKCNFRFTTLEIVADDFENISKKTEWLHNKLNKVLDDLSDFSTNLLRGEW